MMRYLSTDQQEMYQKYFRLSQVLIDYLKLSRIKKPPKKYIWNLLTQEGIWSLPISKKYNGQGLSWQEVLIAIDGFFSGYLDTNFLNVSLSQISSLYIISKYASHEVKLKYLPGLINGNISTIVYSDIIRKQLNFDDYLDKKFNHYNGELKNDLLIYLEEVRGNIHISIKENTPKIFSIASGESINDFKIDQNYLIAKNIGTSALCDVINFERSFYGILSESLLNRINFSQQKRSI